MIGNELTVTDRQTYQLHQVELDLPNVHTRRSAFQLTHVVAPHLEMPSDVDKYHRYGVEVHNVHGAMVKQIARGRKCTVVAREAFMWERFWSKVRWIWPYFVDTKLINCRAAQDEARGDIAQIHQDLLEYSRELDTLIELRRGHLEAARRLDQDTSAFNETEEERWRTLAATNQGVNEALRKRLGDTNMRELEPKILPVRLS